MSIEVVRFKTVDDGTHFRLRVLGQDGGTATCSPWQAKRLGPVPDNDRNSWAFVLGSEEAGQYMRVVRYTDAPTAFAAARSKIVRDKLARIGIGECVGVYGRLPDRVFQHVGVAELTTIEADEKGIAEELPLPGKDLTKFIDERTPEECVGYLIRLHDRATNDFSNPVVKNQITLAGLLFRHKLAQSGIYYLVDDELSRRTYMIDKRLGIAADPEAGIHAHGLERENSRTKTSAGHIHLFVHPDLGPVITEEDGSHHHELSEPTSDFTNTDGDHTHSVTLPNGTKIDTDDGGGHSHENIVAATAFDGTHVHQLEIAGGAKVRSLTGGEFWDQVGRPPQEGNPPVPDASTLNKSVALTTLGDLELRTPIAWVVSDTDDKTQILIQEPGALSSALESQIERMLPPEIASRISVCPGEVPLGDAVHCGDLVIQFSKEPAAVGPSEAAASIPKTGQLLKNGSHGTSKGMGMLRVRKLTEFICILDTPTEIWRLHLPRESSSDIATWLKYFDLDGSRYTMPMTHGSSVPAELLEKRPRGGDLVDEFTIEYGMQLPTLREYFISGGSRIGGGVLRLEKRDGITWLASFGTTMPAVLSAAMVATQTMPSVGFSALPLSLEKRIPLAYRYWTKKDDEAVKLRSAIVTDHLIRPESLAVVNKQLDIITRKTFWSKPGIDATTVPRTNMWALASLFPTSGEDVLIFDDAEGSIEEHIKSAQALTDREYLLCCSDTLGNRASISHLGRPFRLEGRPDRLFVASNPLAKTRGVEWVPGATDALWRATGIDYELSTQTLRKRCRDMYRMALAKRIPVFKKDERIVMGIVLEPDVVDAQQDVISAQEIRDTAFLFMEDFRQIGFMHRQLITDQVKILESYIAPVDFSMGSEKVRKGTWIITLRVLANALWKQIKSGELTGFSIGGTGVRRPRQQTRAA